MSAPGLQRHTFLYFTPTTSNQNLAMTRSMSRRMEGLVSLDVENRSLIFSDPGQARGRSVESWLLSFSRSSTCMVQWPFRDGDGRDQIGGFYSRLKYKTKLGHLWTKSTGFIKSPEGTKGIPSFLWLKLKVI